MSSSPDAQSSGPSLQPLTPPSLDVLALLSRYTQAKYLGKDRVSM